MLLLPLGPGYYDSEGTPSMGTQTGGSTAVKLSNDVGAKDENIGFDGYIGTWILWMYRIYRRYIGGYFYMNIDISKIKLL